MKISTVVIGLCTFRRPQVLETLASLDLQRLPAGISCQIVVVDNDDNPTAEQAVREFAKNATLQIDFLHRPAGNISIARNAVLDHAKSLDVDAIAFLDDDEIAPPDWLSKLLACQDQTHAAVVLGPVRASYAADAPDWMVRGQVHDTLPTVGADGVIRSGYTCNLLLFRRSPAVAQQRFDLARGTSGGEDTAFVSAIYRAGGQIAFASDALLNEAVPPHRATKQWLLTRRFRMGQTHGSLLSEDKSVFRRVAQAVTAFAKFSFCGTVAVLSLTRPLERNRALMRGALHLGTVSALTGFRTIALYGKSNPRGLITPRRSS